MKRGFIGSDRMGKGVEGERVKGTEVKDEIEGVTRKLIHERRRRKK